MEGMNQEITLRYLLIESQEEIYQEQYSSVDAISIKHITQNLLDHGYDLIESTADFTAIKTHLSGNTITIYLREKDSVVFPHAPKQEGEPVSFSNKLSWPAGVSESDLNTHVSRTISFLYENGNEAFEPVVQSIALSRVARVNHANQDVTYMPWSLSSDVDQFEGFDVPDILGYQSSYDQILPKSLDFDAVSDETVKVIYHPEQQSVTIVVIDQTTKEVLFEDKCLGKTGERIDYDTATLLDQFLAKGYELLSNELSEPSYFTAQKDLVYTISVEPKVIEFQPTDVLPEAGTAVYPDLAQSISWPTGLSDTDLNRTVTREILFQFEDGSVAQAPKEQSLHFSRRAIVNLLTGQVHYGQWEGTGTRFESIVPEPIKGYVAKPRVVAEVTGITAKNDSRTEVVSYIRGIQKVDIRFVEEGSNAHLLYRKQLTGRSGEPLPYDPAAKIQEFIAAGYELVSNHFPYEGTFGYDDHDITTYTIGLKPRVLSVLSTEPKDHGNFVDDDKGPRWPAGVSKNDLVKEIKRSIYYVFEDGSEAFPTDVDTVIFSRDAEVNLVTSEVVYSDWHKNSEALLERVIPQLDGYRSNRQDIPEVAFTITSSDSIYTVRYLKDATTRQLNVYDKETKTLLASQETFSNSLDDLLPELEQLSQRFLEQGYTFASERIEDSYDFDEVKGHLSVNLLPVVQQVSASEPKVAYTPISGHKRLTWPKGLSSDDLSRTITRTIRYQNTDGATLLPSIEQKITFTRTAEVDLPEGKVRYGEWESANVRFEAVTNPDIDGYVTAHADVAVQSVTPDSLDSIHLITYHLTPQQILINYVHYDSKVVLKQDKLVGVASESMSYHPVERLIGLGLDGYVVVNSTCPEQLSFEQSSLEYTVYVKERVAHVTWQEPKEAYELLPLSDGRFFSWPSGLDKASLSYASYRHVHYLYEDGRLVREPITQVCEFHRDAFVNLATSEVVYGEWEHSEGSFEALVSPQVQGYESDQTLIPALDLPITGQSQTIIETVTYQPVPYQFVVHVKDVTLDRQLESITMVLKAGSLPDYNLENLLATYQNLGYELVETQVPETLDARSPQQHITLLLAPRFVEVSLEDSQRGFSSMEPLDVKRLSQLSGLGLYDLSCEVKRRIDYVYQKGTQAAPSYESVVHFERQAKVNLVSGEISYGPWSSAYPIFDEVYSPIIADYQADFEVSPSLEDVSAHDGDRIERVTYSPVIQEVVVNIINKTTGDILYAESLPEEFRFNKDKVLEGKLAAVSDQQSLPQLEEEEASEASSTAVSDTPEVSEPALKVPSSDDKPNKVLAYLKDLFQTSEDGE